MTSRPLRSASSWTDVSEARTTTSWSTKRTGRLNAMRLLRSGVTASEPTMTSPLPSLRATSRSEEHTSELQSLRHLVCRLLLEKKKKNKNEKRKVKKENKKINSK